MDENKDVVSRFVGAVEEEEKDAGRVFKEALLADLPEHLRTPDMYFGVYFEIPAEEQEELKQCLDVQSGSPESFPWLRYGVTPLMIFYATEAIGGLFDRLWRNSTPSPVFLSCSSTLTLGEGASQPQAYNLPTMLIEEVRRVAECRPEIAAGLFFWLLEVARYKPAIFEGIGVCVRRDTGFYEFLPVKRPLKTLRERWAMTWRKG